MHVCAARLWIALAVLAAAGGAVAQPAPQPPELALWPVDSMQKVFRDDAPPAGPAGALTIDAARNEVVSGQAVVWCEGAMEHLSCRAGSLARRGGAGEIPAPQVRYVGYVPVAKGRAPRFQLRPRPCDYPDPLFDAPGETIAARTAQPIWLTLRIPRDAAAGLYQGTVEVQAVVAGQPRKAALTVEVKVFAADLPDQRTLKITNWTWFNRPEVAAQCGVTALYSDDYWKLMEAVAKDMAAHRQNVILTPLADLIRVSANASGELAFDFTNFDRWVRLFQAAGVDGLIEGSHLARRRSRFLSALVSAIWIVREGEAVRTTVEALGPENEKYLSRFLPALQSHLQAQGWLGKYVQHVFDEPSNLNADKYAALAAVVRRYAPGIRLVEAVQMVNLVGSVDVWVPLINGLGANLSFLQDRRAKGEEVWFYTCCVPGAEAALNRFIEFPLTRVRLLQWANYASGATGYLHWGWNYWGKKDPFGGRYFWQPGDEWLVYPRKGGVWDSIRWEAMLEGIQDYELLRRLSLRDKPAADALCHKLVTFGGGTYSFDDGIAALRAARRELLTALEKPVAKN